MLETLGRIAVERNTGLVLCIDEMQSIDAHEVEFLAERLQVIVEREELPVHFRGAALPYFWHTTLGDPKKNSFFRRNEDITLPYITEPEAYNGFGRYAETAGGTFTEEALGRAASLIDGSAYMFQLLGHYSWLASGAPERPIATADVEQAARTAVETYNEKVATLTWQDFNRADDGRPVPGTCGRWMPRAKRYCVLAPAHRGRCRSTLANRAS